MNNRRQRDSVFVILAAIVFSTLMAWAGHVSGAQQVVIFSIEEVQQLQMNIANLANERDALKAEVLTLRKKCI